MRSNATHAGMALAPPALAVSRAGKDEAVEVGSGGGGASPRFHAASHAMPPFMSK